MIENEPLAKHTSWRIGGPARYYSQIGSPDDLQAALHWAREHELPVLMLGGGTNMLVRDQGFSGLVLRYMPNDWHIEGQGFTGRLIVQAGAPMANTARRVSALGWRGLEWAEGLPGTVGGAVFGNAGCYGGDIASVLEQAWVLVDGEVQVWSMADWQYSYRRSRLKPGRQATHDTEQGEQAEAPPGVAQALPTVILAAEMRLIQADPAELTEKMAGIAAQRKAKTPWGRSCGSVFKNPPEATTYRPNYTAGRLIDQVGLKGHRIGNAEISQKHANYIINLGEATSDDVLRLIDLAHNAVLHQFGIDLELEVQII
jgi:UDP-N-acetylmuramate dehydrogenase